MHFVNFCSIYSGSHIRYLHDLRVKSTSSNWRERMMMCSLCTSSVTLLQSRPCCTILPPRWFESRAYCKRTRFFISTLCLDAQAYAKVTSANVFAISCAYSHYSAGETEAIVRLPSPSREESPELGGKREDQIPTMEDIMAVAAERNLNLQIRSIGPWFQVLALKTSGGSEVLGTAEGFVTLWTRGWILHLETIRMTREAAQEYSGNFYGAGFLMGAAALRYGLDRNCQTAELLAINDGDSYHSKIVRYYSRLGFKVVNEVTGESWKDFGQRIVWGGLGTRMDASCSELLKRWSRGLKPKCRTNPPQVQNINSS